LRKIPERRDALCFHDEFSGSVWIPEDYKYFGETRPACRLPAIRRTARLGGVVDDEGAVFAGELDDFGEVGEVCSGSDEK